MGKFKINFRVVVALIVIVGAIYLAYDAVQTETLSGQTLNITTSGVMKVTNSADEPATVNTTAKRTYTISVSGQEKTTIRPTHEGSGASSAYIAEIELPPGLTTLSVTRGSDVTFDLQASAPLKATVGARSDEANRSVIFLAAAVCIASVVYMSFATQHAWFRLLRNRITNTADDAVVSPT